MKHFLTLILLLLPATGLLAQEVAEFRYGYVAYESVLVAMPDYASIDVEIAQLKQQYDAELKESEEEFTHKYETFLAEYSTYAPSILRKRQAELEDMMRRNEAFQAECEAALIQTRADRENDLKAQLNEAIETLANEYGLAFVLNTDSNAVPFLNPRMAYNLTPAVSQAVGIEVVSELPAAETATED